MLEDFLGSWFESVSYTKTARSFDGSLVALQARLRVLVAVLAGNRHWLS